MVKIKFSIKKFFQRVKNLLLIPFAFFQNVYIRCRKLLKNAGKFLRLAKEWFLKRWFFKKWNFYMGDFSFKRIYRNSEGHIIPLLGGVIALSVFYSINACMHMYLHSMEGSGSSENKTTIILPLGLFTIILIVVGIIIYQLKKANLRDSIAKNLAEIFIKHVSPYSHADLREVPGKEIKEMKIQNRSFHMLFRLDFNAENLIEKYIACNNLDYIFNKNEIKSEINNKTKENITNAINKKLNEIPEKEKEEIERKIDLNFKSIIKVNKELSVFFLVKEGNLENPKNSRFFEIDVEKNNPPFVVFENLDSKDKNKFFDVNTKQIIQAQYQGGEVILTIAQSHATATSPSPQKIKVSLSEWLANRNNLR